MKVDNISIRILPIIGISHILTPFSSKGDKFCDFLFASLGNIEGSTFSGKNLPLGSLLFPLRLGSKLALLVKVANVKMAELLP